jgi:predicted DNA-binding transcriptional regulator AlpA
MATRTPTLSIKQVMALAGVSHMAVFHWRAGSTKREALPTVAVEGSRSVAFQPRVLKAWAKKHGVELKHDPVSVATGEVALEIPAKEATKPTKATKKSAKPAAKTARKARNRTSH